MSKTALLKTGFTLILLMLMMTNPTMIMKRTGPLMKTRSVMKYPETMISGLVQMETYGDDTEPPDIGDRMEKMTNTKENPTKTFTLLTVEEIIGGQKENSMMASKCPTGGLYNILRFAKSVVGRLFQEFRNLWEEDKKSIIRGDKGEEMTKTEEKSAKGKMPDTEEKNDRNISWEMTNTRVGPIKNPVIMNM